MQLKKQFESPPIYGVIFFWISCVCVILGFWVSQPVISAILLAFNLSILYSSHEALHDTLLPRHGKGATLRNFHSGLALTIGFALQGMNFQLLRPAHLHHHTYGRYDDGWAPDVFPHPPTFGDRVRYYINLCGYPALWWQLAGFARLVVPPKRLPLLVDNIRFNQEKSKIPYVVVQLVIALFFVYAFLVGGWVKLLIFELVFCFLWSILQNVSHYGLRGIDAQTDRLCARTYILEFPFRLFTFGSTSHLAHHTDMQIPGVYLHEPEVLAYIEEKIGVQIEVKYGLWSFVTDVARQFKGPLCETELTTSWIKGIIRPLPETKRVPLSFGERKGRTWVAATVEE